MPHFQDVQDWSEYRRQQAEQGELGTLHESNKPSNYRGIDRDNNLKEEPADYPPRPDKDATAIVWLYHKLTARAPRPDTDPGWRDWA